METIKSILKDIHDSEIHQSQLGFVSDILKDLPLNIFPGRKLKKLIMIRYQLSHMFEGFLENVMEVVEQSGLPKDIKGRLYHAVHQNYLEEKGLIGEYGGPHIEGRETLLRALGVDYGEWQKPLGTYAVLGKVNPSVEILVRNIRGIVHRGPIEAITALWYYENRISLDGTHGDYYILLRAFENAFPEFRKASLEEYKEGDVLWHLASHAAHDEYHAELAADGLAALPMSVAVGHTIRLTCSEMRIYFDSFWNTLRSEVA